MIKFYYRQGCGSSQKAKSWFEKYKINVDMKKLVKFLSKTCKKFYPIWMEELRRLLNGRA